MIARQCYSASLQTVPWEALSIKVLDTKDEGQVISIEMMDRLLQWPLDTRLLKETVKIRSKLSRQESTKLKEALKQNMDVFTWSAQDIPGVSPEVIIHRLNVDLTYHTVKQKRRNFILDRS